MIKIISSVFAFCVVAATAQAGEPSKLRDEVKAVLDAQGAAWNAGDLDAYLSHYAKGPDTVHITGGEIITGSEAIGAGYRARNPDPSAYGEIAYTDLKVTALSDRAAIAHAPWSWTLGEASAEGVFTLVLEEIDGAWRVVHDHTTLSRFEGS